MRVFNKFRGTEGWLFMWERTIRYLHMRNETEVRRRAKAIDFWKKHGLAAALDAFDVSRPTLFRWQQALAKKQGHLDALDPRSTAPKNKRRRRYHPKLLERIIEHRTAHHRLGKGPLTVLLNAEGFRVSESYIGRCLCDLRNQGRLPTYRHVSISARTGKMVERKRLRRKKIRRAHKRGIETDTVVRFVDGIRRYIYTAIDVEKKFAFAAAYTTHSSASAADFLGKLIAVAPFPVTEIQTDNGSEFAAHFSDACKRLGIVQYHTYPRCPKMNCHVERFNRTLSEDFIAFNRGLLRDDLRAFNEALIDWLLWYNTVRPHQSLGMRSPLGYIVSTLPTRESQRYWTRTTD
jgi:transposase InsO family protein